MKSTWILTVVAGWLASLPVTAAIQTETVEYREGDAVLEGYLAWDDSITGKRPAVVIVHQWKGLTDYERKRAQMLARLGYVAFAADIYGKGIRAADADEAGKLAGKFKSDLPLLRSRVKAAVDHLKKHERVNPGRVAAIGYCFGGTTVLELARSGADVQGVVSFHGGLGTSLPARKGEVKSKVLVLHGADDPYSPAAEVSALQNELRQAGVDWQLVLYGGAVHSFTDWDAGADNSRGAAYNERADKRSWEAMKQFLNELFQSGQ
ncbi:MAG: dienelactone hydrolase family protein [Verrucomicrobia bacterium]|jgi:dienelactone hydrolase|nr:dienelactone hydrolase family protein [Verrucomicrobiota bacterium]